jgi:carboxypeptidase Q
MTMVRPTAAAAWMLVSLAVAAPGAPAQERIDHDAIATIRDEGFNRSPVLETAIRLSDVNGPRLAGSPGYLRAAEWVRAQMDAWGFAGARLEPWGRRGSGWEIERFSVEMTAPYYLNLTAIPKAWSSGTDGTVRGAPVLVRIRREEDLEQYRGRLRGRIVLNGAIEPIRDRNTVPMVRWTDAQLDSLERLTDPGEPRTYWEDTDGWLEALQARERIERFYRDEGVALIVEGSSNPVALRAAGHVSYTTDPRGRVPAVIVARGEFNQLARMLERGVAVELEAAVRTRFLEGDTIGYNVVAEIPGADRRLRDQVVLVGGHLDSWHVGTGATDNAAGVAVAMEALRILRASGLQPRRTIRVALWDGEEQEDYHGSSGYVRRHLGEPETMTLRPGHGTLSAYFNLDNGTGRIRGIFAQGNHAAVPIFREFLAPFADLEATTVSIANVGSTDHMPFTSVGLPAFQFIQDRLDYHSRTHHTDLDRADYLVEDDMKQAAVVLASILYHVANRDALLPRGSLPEPRP